MRSCICRLFNAGPRSKNSAPNTFSYHSLVCCRSVIWMLIWWIMLILDMSTSPIKLVALLGQHYLPNPWPEANDCFNGTQIGPKTSTAASVALQVWRESLRFLPEWDRPTIEGNRLDFADEKGWKRQVRSVDTNTVGD